MSHKQRIPDFVGHPYVKKSERGKHNENEKISAEPVSKTERDFPALLILPITVPYIVLMDPPKDGRSHRSTGRRALGQGGRQRSGQLLSGKGRGDG